MSKNTVVDFKNETFESKVKDLIDNLGKDLKELYKQHKFHSKIVEALKNDEDIEIRNCVKIVKDSIKETNEVIDAVNKRLEKSTTLLKFLEGNLILDLDQFAMLMIEVLGSQMVNYVELKNEHIAVSKKWIKKPEEIN